MARLKGKARQRARRGHRKPPPTPEARVLHVWQRMTAQVSTRIAALPPAAARFVDVTDPTEAETMLREVMEGIARPLDPNAPLPIVDPASRATAVTVRALVTRYRSLLVDRLPALAAPAVAELDDLEDIAGALVEALETVQAEFTQPT